MYVRFPHVRKEPLGFESNQRGHFEGARLYAMLEMLLRIIRYFLEIQSNNRKEGFECDEKRICIW